VFVARRQSGTIYDTEVLEASGIHCTDRPELLADINSQSVAAQV
jgi:hypothetical protein